MKLSLNFDHLKPKLSKFHKDFIGFIILFAFISVSLAFLDLALNFKILEEESFQKAEASQVQEENSQKPEIPKPKLPGKPQTQIIHKKNNKIT